MTSICFVGQDGTAPSGVSTYGYGVLAAYPEARMLLLNAREQPSAAPRLVRDRIRCLPEAVSHSVTAVARELRELFDPVPERLVVLPNTGDTPWSATVEWVSALSHEERERVRVLGVVHSDVETQYAGAETHATFASAWIGVSVRCAETLRRRLAGVPRSVYEMPYPMALPVRSHQPSTSGPLRLVYAGRLEEPQKRVSRLGSLFSMLAAQRVEFRATIAGSGPARDALERSVTTATAAQNVDFRGPLGHDALSRLLGESHVFLLTSAYEGLPLALLESMAAGLCPVVMAVESGLPDLLEEGVNARIVPQGDVVAMAAVVAELARDPAQTARLGAAARETVANRLSPDAHFRRLDAIMDELWSAPSPDPATVSLDPTADAVAGMVARLKRIGKPVGVFGAGMFGRKVLDACLNGGVEIVALFDSDSSRQGRAYRGLTCRAPETMMSVGVPVLAIGSLEFAAEMRTKVELLAGNANALRPEIVSAEA